MAGFTSNVEGGDVESALLDHARTLNNGAELFWDAEVNLWLKSAL